MHLTSRARALSNMRQHIRIRTCRCWRNAAQCVTNSRSVNGSRQLESRANMAEVLTRREQDYVNKVLETGSWITTQFLEDLIRRHEKDVEVTLLDKQVAPAVGLGNNYLSTLYRIGITYSKKGTAEQEKHIIIKGYPTAPASRTMVENLGVFRTEIQIYNDVLPRMNAILGESTRDQFIAPESYASSLDNIVIMEDLKVAGYKMVNRRRLLDFEHALASLKSLARFHALSLAVEQRHPGIIDKYQDKFGEDSKMFMETFLIQQMSMLAKLMREDPQLVHFGDMIDQCATDAWNRMLNGRKSTPGFLNVLSHGDAWLTNIMFSYDDRGRVLHAKLIDFQICYYSSPAMDVLHILFSSLQPDVLKNSMFKLIEEYYNALQADVRLFGIDVRLFTLQEFHREIEKRAFQAFFLMCAMLPNVLAKTDDVFDMDTLDETFSIADEDLPLNKIFEDKYCRDVIIQYFNHFVAIGFDKLIKAQTSSLINLG